MPPRVVSLLQARAPMVQAELDSQGLENGSPVFVRIFKWEQQLELWMKQGDSYKLFKTYPICSYSGYPGPKLREGDSQGPEGFYSFTPEQMNPVSNYHLSFDIGYPNAVDEALGRTGSLIMVHGKCESRGCFAMGNDSIEELFLLAYNAFVMGQQKIDVHIFPFRMNTSNLTKFQYSPWFSFWQQLLPGYNYFEETRRIPEVTMADGKYFIASQARFAGRVIPAKDLASN